MSFIGNTPAESYSTVVKDTFSGNDSDTDFTLSIPATTNSVEVLVENVQQEPTTAYTISGTTLSFTAAPVTGTNNIYVIHRGPAVQQVVPPAGVAIDASTVTASSTISATGDISTEGDVKVEVASGGIYTITGTDTASNRTLTLPDEAGTVLTSATSISTQATQNVPLFQVRRITSNQGISGSTWTKVDFNSTEVDTNSWVTGDDTFTPQIAGWYQFTINLILAGASCTFIAMRLMKNGSEAFVTSHMTVPSTNSAFITGGSLLIHMNGSTDYIEGQAFIIAVNSSEVRSDSNGDTSMQGFLVRAD